MLNEKQIDILKELINIGVGKAAALLNEMVLNPIKLSVPELRILKPSELRSYYNAKYSGDLTAVKLEFNGTFNGVAELIFPKESAINLVYLLSGEVVKSDEVDSIKISTLTEIGNILINSLMGTISNLISGKFEYSLPMFYDDIQKDFNPDDAFNEKHLLLVSHTNFEINTLKVVGEIIIILSIDSLDKLISELEKLDE